jgi:hypothetical protein
LPLTKRGEQNARWLGEELKKLALAKIFPSLLRNGGNP